MPRSEGRERAQKLGEIIARLNEGKPPGAQIKHDITVPFGPRMLLDRFLLGNGLRVLALEDASSPAVCVQLWLGVGSRHEREGKTGMAHLFEHLMFGEADDDAFGSFDRVLEEAGANTNAATSPDWTSYQTILPKGALALAIKLEAQRFSGLALRDDQVAREKEIIRNERRQRVDGSIDGSAVESLYKEAFREHAYRFPTIGWKADLDAITLDDCRAFHRSHYVPNNASMIVVGDLDHEELLASVQEHCGALAPARLPVEDVRPEAAQPGERWVRVRKPTPVDRAVVGYRGPALGDFDHAPLHVLAEILFGGPSSRSHQALIHERPLASDIRFRLDETRDPSLLTVFVTARGRNTAIVLLQELEGVLDGARLAPLDQPEIDKGIAQLELDFFKDIDSLAGKAERIGLFQTVLGDPAALTQRLEAIRRVGPGDVLRVARRYLLGSSRTVIEILPLTGRSEGDSFMRPLAASERL